MSTYIQNLYTLFKKHPVITTDSRNTPEGSIFFALKGESFNGNNFALEALKKGCAIAVVDDEALKKTPNCFYVPDVLRALQRLARYHRNKFKIPVIGITGSNGKTTTKELITAVLSKKYNTQYTQGNLNNHIGVPLTLLSINDDHEMAIVEMGANHIGEIKKLCSIAHPTHGIITNIGKAHLEGFGSFEGVIQAKTELYKYLNNHKGSITFVNSENTLLMKHASTLNTYTYGFKQADCSFNDPQANPFVELKWEGMPVKSNLIGAYNTENIMAAICIGSYFEVYEFDISKAISEYIPKNKRSEIVSTKHNEIILDAYNANPSSMKEAILNFRQMDKENPMLILGDMFELGVFSKEEHYKIIELVRNLGFRDVVFAGKSFKEEENCEFSFFETTDELIKHLKDSPVQNKDILIKGSRGMQLENLVKYL